MSIGMQLCDMDGDDDDDDVYDHVISYVGYYSSFPAMKTYQKSTTKVDQLSVQVFMILLGNNTMDGAHVTSINYLFLYDDEHDDGYSYCEQIDS